MSGLTDSWEAFAARCGEQLAAGPDRIWDCQRSFEALARSHACLELVHTQLHALLDNPTRSLEMASSAEWILAQTDRLCLSFVAIPRTLKERPVLLPGSACHRLWSVVSRGPVDVQLYRHAVSHPPDVFDRERAIEPFGTVTLLPGEVLALEAWREIADPVPVPGAFLVEIAAYVNTTRWSYDRETLRPCAVASARAEASRIEYALWTLVQLGHPDSVKTAARLYEHPSHHVRWTTVRAVLEMDRAQGLSLLERAATDPHPHVAEAARRGLARFGVSS